MGRDCLSETQFCPMGIPSLFKTAIGGNDRGELGRVLYFRHGDHYLPFEIRGRAGGAL